MQTKTPYWRQQVQCAWTLTLAQLRSWSWLFDLAAFPVVGYTLLKSHEYIDRGIPTSLSFLEWLTKVPELGLWNTLLSGTVVLLAHWTINWIRAPGEMDRQHRDEFEEQIQQVNHDARELDMLRQKEIESLKDQNHLLHQKVDCFEKRLRPNIWITGKIYGDSPIADIYSPEGGMNVGFTIENRSDSELHDVQVGIIKIEWMTCDRYKKGGKFMTFEDMGFNTKLPIMLEWSPDEQGSEEVLCTTIPAGENRLVGLFSCATILSARHDIRQGLPIHLPFVYKVAIRLSARGVRAITSRDYIVSRIGMVKGEEIPYEIEPKGTVQLLNEQED